MGCSVVRGIRGAITVEQNDAAGIMAAVKELLLTMINVNQIQVEDIASIIFRQLRIWMQHFRQRRPVTWAGQMCRF